MFSILVGQSEQSLTAELNDANRRIDQLQVENGLLRKEKEQLEKSLMGKVRDQEAEIARLRSECEKERLEKEEIFAQIMSAAEERARLEEELEQWRKVFAPVLWILCSIGSN